ncbi:DDE-Tnp-1-7 domain-containing protein [Fusarium sp. Ph1]|nr:DDE-Tnp-1-7 domain-containing protein [Fusarium sp. Ph1]
MQLFRPGSHLAIDECIIRYTGRSDAITTIKSKPDPVGFKIWVIAQLGFFIHWLWHIKDAEHGAVGVEISTQILSSQPSQPSQPSQARSRKRRKVSAKAAEEAPDIEDDGEAVNSTQAVVIGLTKTLPKSTYHVFVDNLFSSPPLFRNLRKQGYGATGTARANSGIHEELVRDKNDDGKVKKMYEFNAVKAIPTPDNQVNQIAWKDTKLVLFLSTVFTGADDERVIRQRKKPSSKKSEAKPIRRFFRNEAVEMINIPTVAAAYNDEMNHVDRGDQLRSYYKYDHALRRGPWQALAWTFLLDVALVNSYVAQLHGQPKWKRYTNHRQWRECIYNELFNAYGHDSQARQLYRAGDERDLQDAELQRKHVDREINFINRHAKSDCLACQGCRQGQLRTNASEWSPLTEVSGNQEKTERKRPKVRSQTTFGCRICDVAICQSKYCWDFYHHLI